MASNAPTRKPSNSANSRNSLSHKSLKLEMTSLVRTYHQPVSITASGKDVSKDKERKLKPQILKINTKQSMKRVEVVEPERPVVPKASSNERHMVMAKQHMEQQPQTTRPLRKIKLDDSVSRTKDLRAAVVDTLSVSKQHLKDSKSPEKPEPVQRQIRTKNQSLNTKIFFDKYLKFAYDLSTPTGVRQLEEHFFPKEQCKTHSKANELGNSNAKQQQTNDDTMATVRQNTESIDQKTQQSKCFEDAQ